MRFHECNLHGLHRLEDNESGKVFTKSNMFWLAVFCVAVAAFFIEAMVLVAEFSEGKTSVNIEVNDISELRFPAVTICPLNPFKMSKVNYSTVINNAQAVYNYISQKNGQEGAAGRTKRSPRSRVSRQTKDRTRNKRSAIFACPPNFDTEPSYETNCYHKLTPSDWTTAVAECNGLKATSFPFPQSAAENDFLSTTFAVPTGKSVVISVGDSNKEGTYRKIYFTGTTWAEGEVITYSNWKYDQPDNGCLDTPTNSDKVRLLAVDSYLGLWGDASTLCFQSFSDLFVCQRPMQDLCLVDSISNAVSDRAVGEKLEPGEVVAYTAALNYSIMSGSSTLECSIDGSFIGEITVEANCYVPSFSNVVPDAPVGSMVDAHTIVTYSAMENFTILSSGVFECVEGQLVGNSISVISAILSVDEPLPTYFDIALLSEEQKAVFEEFADVFGIDSESSQSSVAAQVKSAMTSAALELDDTTRSIMTSSIHEMATTMVFEGRMLDASAFTSIPHATYGSCKTFNRNASYVAEGTSERNGLHLVIVNEANNLMFTTETLGAAVQVHEPWVFPFPETHGMLLSTGLDYSLLFSKTVRRRIHKCTTNASIIHDTFDSFYQYNHEACVRNCVQKNVANRIGCFDTSTMKPKEDDRPYCTATNKNLSSAVLQANKECVCLPPCAETLYKTTISQASWPIGVDRTGRICSKVNADFCDVKSSVLVMKVNFNSRVFDTEQEILMMDMHTLLAKISNACAIWFSFGVTTLIELVFLGKMLIEGLIMKITNVKKSTSRAKRPKA